MSNDNEPDGNGQFMVIPIDPALRDVPCIFCLTQGRHRTKRTHPHLEFWGNEQYTICTEHAEEAMFSINNVDRAMLRQWNDSMREFFKKRAEEG